MIKSPRPGGARGEDAEKIERKFYHGVHGEERTRRKQEGKGNHEVHEEERTQRNTNIF